MTITATTAESQALHWIDAAVHDALDADFPVGVDINGQKLRLFDSATKSMRSKTFVRTLTRRCRTPVVL